MNTREFVKTIDDYTTALDNSGGTGGTLPLYIGKTYPGHAKSDNKWKIVKLTYDANDNITDVKWAEGNTRYTKVWDDRASYSYS